MASPAALPIADVRADSALRLERCGDALWDVFGELAGDAKWGYHHFAGRDVLPKEDRPLSHGDCWQILPVGVLHDVTVALHKVLVRHHCCLRTM